jgi:hypothetical protein
MFGTFATRLLLSPFTGSEMCRLNERGRESNIAQFVAKMEIINL